MADFYAQQAPLASITTAQLERHLYCESGEIIEVRRAFHRFVYGFEGEPAAPPQDYCD